MAADLEPAQTTLTFPITMMGNEPPNEPPVFTLLGTEHTVLEDADAVSVPWLTDLSAVEEDQTVTLTVTNDNNGLFAVQPAIDSATGILTYTVAPDQYGSATVTVTATDDGGTENGGQDTTTKRFTITVTPVNDAPTFLLSQTFVSFDSDPSPNTMSGLVYGISAGPNEAGQALRFEVTVANWGRFFQDGPKITQYIYDPELGILTLTPKATANGTATVVIRLIDDGGTENGGVDTSEPQTLLIEIQGEGPGNTAPAFTEAVTNTKQSMRVGEGLEALLATDPEDDPFTFAVTAGTLPPGIHLEADGTFSGVVATGSKGSYTVEITVSDGDLSSTTTLKITGAAKPVTGGGSGSGNGAPWFTSPEVLNVAENEGLPALSATDPDGDALTFSLLSGFLPPGISLNLDGSFVGTSNVQSAGTYVVTVGVHDGKGGSASLTLTIHVANVDLPPSLEAISDEESVVGDQVDHDLQLQPQLGHHSKYMSGYSDGTFRPEQALTRAEAAVVLARLFGPGEENGALRFTDLPADHWAAQAIATVSAQGLMNGNPDGQFRPDGSLTRAEIAVIVARVKGLTPSAGAAFADAQGHWAAAQIQAVFEAGIMQGLSGNRFEPDRPVTRAEFVTAMNRVMGRNPVPSGATPAFSDVGREHWAFDQIQEAAQDHTFRLQPDGTELHVQTAP